MTINYAFTGDTLSWLYTAGPTAARRRSASTLPRAPRRPREMWTVDQYSPAVEFGRRLDLTGPRRRPPHRRRRERRRALPRRLPRPHRRRRRRAARRGPQRRHHQVRLGDALGGPASSVSYAYSAAADSATAFTFSGTALTWQYVRRPDGGIARVWIDGVGKGTRRPVRAPPQASRRALRQRHLRGRGSGTHTILIVNTGEKSPVSTAPW